MRNWFPIGRRWCIERGAIHAPLQVTADVPLYEWPLQSSTTGWNGSAATDHRQAKAGGDRADAAMPDFRSVNSRKTGSPSSVSESLRGGCSSC